jgi:hypothetical protein
MAKMNHKNEMDALYHTVKEMDEVQLRLMRLYAEHLRETQEATNAQLLHRGNFLVSGSAHIH